MKRHFLIILFFLSFCNKEKREYRYIKPFPFEINSIKECKKLGPVNIFNIKIKRAEEADTIVYCEYYKGELKELRKKVARYINKWCNKRSDKCKWLEYIYSLTLFLSYKSSFLEDTIKQFKDLIKRYSKFSPAYFKLAIFYNLNEDCKESIRYLRRAISLKPNNPKYLLFFSLVLAECGKRKESISILNRLKRFKLDYEKVNFAKKIESLLFKPCYKEPPKVEYIWRESSELIEKRGSNIGSAIRLLEKGIEEYPLATCLKELLGIALLQVGNRKDAIYYFEKAYKEDRFSWIAMENLAYIYFENKEMKKAEFYLKELIKIRPFYSTPYILLSKIYETKKLYKEAISLLEEVIKFEKLNYNLGIRLLNLYRKVGDHKSEKRLYQRLKSLFPELNNKFIAK